MSLTYTQYIVLINRYVPIAPSGPQTLLLSDRGIDHAVKSGCADYDSDRRCIWIVHPSPPRPGKSQYQPRKRLKRVDYDTWRPL